MTTEPAHPPGPHTHKVTHELVELTSALAEKWLGHNLCNRHLRRQKVQQYAQDMRSGNYQTSGQSIQFDWGGRMIDGQHRCGAVIESGGDHSYVRREGTRPAIA